MPGVKTALGKDGKRMIRGAIFDVDGTLLNSMYVWETIGERYLRSLSIEPRENLWEIFKTFTLEQAAQYFREQYGVPFTCEKIMQQINGMIEQLYFEEVQLRPGVPAFLQRLQTRGVPMTIATATDRYLVQAALKRCGVLPYFRKIITCREAGSKTQPQIYETARSCMNTPKQETWVFEDALHAACTAAQAGFPVLGIRDPSEKNQQELQTVSTVYLNDFQHAEPFWKFVSP